MVSSKRMRNWDGIALPIPWNSLQYVRLRMWAEGHQAARDDWKRGLTTRETPTSLPGPQLRLLAAVEAQPELVIL